MDTEQHHERRSNPLYDLVEHIPGGSAFYSLYSQCRFFSVEILVLENGTVCEGNRYQVNNDMQPYPDALGGDHRYHYIPSELEERVATLKTALNATPPEQRAALSPDHPESVSRAWRSRSQEISRGWKR
jgi:hypothetical protein